MPIQDCNLLESVDIIKLDNLYGFWILFVQFPLGISFVLFGLGLVCCWLNFPDVFGESAFPMYNIVSAFICFTSLFSLTCLYSFAITFCKKVHNGSM